MRSILKITGGLLVVCAVIWSGLSVLASRDVRATTEGLKAQRQIAETAHGPLEHVIQGEGPPVMVVHGAGGGFDQGLLFAEAFGGDGYRWIAPSRFGYLGSPLPEDPSTRAQADAFADLLDRLGVQRVAVLAVSGGVPPALQFAAHHPERTLGLVLISPAPFTPHGAPERERPIPGWLYRALFGSDTVYWTLSKLGRGYLREAFDARTELLNKISDDERRRIDRLVDGFLPASRRMDGIANEIAAIDPATSYSLEDIASPTLVIHARDDRINPFTIAVDLSERIANAEFLPFKNGGHLLLGHHEDVKKRVRAFLEGLIPSD